MANGQKKVQLELANAFLWHYPYASLDLNVMFPYTYQL